jgi:hypothetical protein
MIFFVNLKKNSQNISDFLATWESQDIDNKFQFTSALKSLENSYFRFTFEDSVLLGIVLVVK